LSRLLMIRRLKSYHLILLKLFLVKLVLEM
jgi:hypothetical protein